MAAPLAYLLYEGAGVAPEVWLRLLRTQVFQLLVNTVVLAVSVTVGAVGLGLLLAWLVERTDLPGRKVLGHLLISPLIVPDYVVATCYVAFFGANGLLEKWLALLGWPASAPSIYGLGGAAFVLMFATYPYVYLMTRSTLRRFDPALIEAARSSGANRPRIALRIVLPLLTPALSAGAILASLYVLSDFGVATQMRYRTFVFVIYQQLVGRFDSGSAAVLGTVLVLLAFALLWGQGRVLSLSRRRFSPEKPSGRPLSRVRLGIWKGPALAIVILALLAGLIVPLGVLLYWWIESALAPNAYGHLWGTSGQALLGYMGNSFSASAVAATLAVLLALPVAYASVRLGGRVSGALAGLSQSGQALPGVLIALGLLILILRFAPVLYATVAAVVLAYLVRFFPQALQATRSGWTQIPAHLEEGARTLRHGPIKAFARVTLPLLRPALAGGWILVFSNALRELPATLILRPLGFETLPVRVWTAAVEGFYGQAAPAALLLVALSIPLIYWIHRGQAQRRNGVSHYD